MDKSYNNKSKDKYWQKFWEENSLYTPEKSHALHKKPVTETFCIVMPPPNVTGVLHQGHALFLAIQDSLIRWNRMLGKKTLYLPGTDHAAIAVQMQVAKHLDSQGINFREEGKENFLKHCWEWIEKFRPRINFQIKSMGTSCDWNRSRFTLDKELNTAVNHAFKKLYDQGLIYRAQKLVNWTPAGQTVLSNQEVIHQNKNGFLWHMKYQIENSNDFVIVATTRPETLLGDAAVAVNPKDKRYANLIGKNVHLPIVNKLIPVIADDFVDMEFGSGVVKITPAHDFNDFECGERHSLAKIQVIDKNAKIISDLGGEANDFAGQDRFTARKNIVEYLKNKNLIEKIEKHQNNIGISERFNDVVEPMLSKQWYVDVKKMAATAIKDYQNAEIEILPEEFQKQFLRWMENIHDWCISRQLWWGHPIPAYYHKKTGEVVVSETNPGDEYTQDEDVLDTWFSSGLWPFSTLGWPDESASDYKDFYPTQILETGFDILFFWVARMIMLGKNLTGKNPFSKIYLHPMVRDGEGKKMSKTIGNVIDPIEIIEKHGADTLRFTLHALCIQGRDLNLSEDRIIGYRNFTNKVWNASRFTLANVSNKKIDWQQPPKSNLLHDQWIVHKLNETFKKVNKSWSEFKIQEAAQTIYHFWWQDLCDWYLECCKTSKEDSEHTLLFIIGESLKLLHPICPHITEEIWHQLPNIKAEESISTQEFSTGFEFLDSESASKTFESFELIQNIIKEIRTSRNNLGIAPGKTINIGLNNLSDNLKDILNNNLELIKSLAKIDQLNYSIKASKSDFKTTITNPNLLLSCELIINTEGLINYQAEIDRLTIEKQQLVKYQKVLNAKLNNAKFVNNAPTSVVDSEKTKLAQTIEKLTVIDENIKKYQDSL